MNRLDVPFNINLLQLTPEKLKIVRQVKSLDMMEGATKNFHPDGLYSTEIFGIVGGEARSVKFGYIDLKIEVIHPTIYNTLIQLKSLYKEILSGKEFARWDLDLNDFVKSDIVDGNTGFEFFISHFKDIKFESRPSVRREQAIKLIEKYKNKALVSKVPVLPAGLRDVEVDGSGRTTSDEINEFYYKLLAISNTISPSTVKISPEAYNSQRMSLQNALVDIYTYLSKIVEGKKNLMMGKWASRKIFNGTRNVITSMDTVTSELGSLGSIGFNDTGVGIYQTLKAMLPISQFQLRNGFINTCFATKGAPVLLTNRNTLLSERVEVSSEVYDDWMSNAGLEKFITYFQENSIRHNPVIIADHYLGLMYRGPDGTFKLIHGIDELPEGRSKEDCTPLTIAEYLYTQIYMVANKYPGYVTRYPVTGIGSVYPSKIYLRSTVKSEVRSELGDDWKPMGEDRISYQFPVIGSDFFNSLSPHPSKLKGLTADFDGD
jgi:hypothetical protein